MLPALSLAASARSWTCPARIEEPHGGVRWAVSGPMISVSPASIKKEISVVASGTTLPRLSRMTAEITAVGYDRCRYGDQLYMVGGGGTCL
ncbi:MAG: hypothetical protein ACKVJG_01160 [Candidatus Latescibacterota bacterium]